MSLELAMYGGVRRARACDRRGCDRVAAGAYHLLDPRGAPRPVVVDLCLPHLEEAIRSQFVVDPMTGHPVRTLAEAHDGVRWRDGVIRVGPDRVATAANRCSDGGAETGPHRSPTESSPRRSPPGGSSSEKGPPPTRGGRVLTASRKHRMVLEVLRELRVASRMALQARVGLGRSLTQRLLRELADAGLVSRTADGRSHRYRVTPEALELLQAVVP